MDTCLQADKDGRIVVSCDPVCITKSTIKFLLLNSSVYFGEVLSQCRAVIVAGGTMAPIPDFVARLVAKNLPEPVPVSVFTCGHVVPAHHLLPLAVCKGPSGIPLNFSFKNRADPHLGPKLMKELGQMVLNFCNVCPDGMVLFLPSYDYEQKLYDTWNQLGILAKLEVKKKIFREPHEVGAVDAVLEAYGSCIAEGKRGSLLLSVVGGKLSEGINFKDELGRCIIMVGLPFANSHSAELKEKMEYLKSLEAAAARGCGGGGGGGRRGGDASPAKGDRDAGSVSVHACACAGAVCRCCLRVRVVRNPLLLFCISMIIRVMVLTTSMQYTTACKGACHPSLCLVLTQNLRHIACLLLMHMHVVCVLLARAPLVHRNTMKTCACGQ